jgi:VanZ family protein
LPAQTLACFYAAVSRTHRFFRYWLPVAVWMTLIFSASGDPKSSQTTSRIIAPAVRFFVPDISERHVEQIVFFVRKTAHVTEYAILAWLLARALLKPGTPQGRWRRKLVLIAWAVVVLYSASDEIHQAFVPNRSPRAADVALDSFGAALGLAALYYFGRWRKYW